MQKCKRGLDAFPSLQICACLFILLSVRFKIDLPSRWLESSTVASRRLQSNVISEVESQALFQRRERRLLRGSWRESSPLLDVMSLWSNQWKTRCWEKTSRILAISELRRELGRVSNSNQSINWHNRIKGYQWDWFFEQVCCSKVEQRSSYDSWNMVKDFAYKPP